MHPPSRRDAEWRRNSGRTNRTRSTVSPGAAGLAASASSGLPPDQALASVRAGLVTDLPVGDELRKRLDAAPQPEEMPYFTDILVDDSGFLWVRPYEPARDATVVGGRPDVHVVNAGGEWQVFDSDGTYVRSIRVPDDLAPYQITSTALVGISRSELGWNPYASTSLSDIERLLTFVPETGRALELRTHARPWSAADRSWRSEGRRS